jgi:hypothetical protein
MAAIIIKVDLLFASVKFDLSKKSIKNNKLQMM